MTKLSDLGERKLVQRLIEFFGSEGLGDDAAVLPMGNHNLLLTADVVNQRTHIPPGATAEQVGWYAVAINFSDIAAMGGEPLGFLLALTLPRDTEVSYLDGLAKGVQGCVKEYGTEVLGGDTKEGPEVSLCGVAVGRTRGRNVLRRHGFRPGDMLAVTGQLGRGGWAENVLRSGKESRRATEALMEVRPRVREGLILAASDATTACMDISDGLAASIAQLRERGGHSFVVDYGQIPVTPLLKESSEAERREALLYHGGDFELLFTVQPSGWDSLTRQLSRVKAKATVIGEVVEGVGDVLRVDGMEEPLEALGYEHFR